MIERVSYEGIDRIELEAAEELQHARFQAHPTDEIWEDIVKISAELLKREVL